MRKDFQHPPTEDIACFAIWERGRTKEAEIISDLASHFEILGTFHIHWSEKNYNRNIARLYESDSGTEPFYKYSKKIGKPPFTFIIVRDKKPLYTHMKSASGAIEPSNRNVVDRKYAYRSLFNEAFQIHSSCNAYEFVFQAALVLGIKTLEETLRGENKGRVIELRKDLEGADGWRDWSELFSILNYCAHYLVLKNFEALPEQLDNKTIDFLCDDYQRLASAANIYQTLGKPYTGKMRVGQQDITANVRFIGDGYYPAPWGKDILDNRTTHKNIYVPRPKDLFFSLLYHTKAHKRGNEAKHAPALTSVAQELHYDWFAADKICNDADMGASLSGYMRANKYFYEQPLDKEVGKNTVVVKALPHLTNIGAGASKQKLRKLKNALRRFFKKR